MNTTENLISTGCPTSAQQPVNQIAKPIKFPAQPQEWKIVSLRECPLPENMQQCETPDQAAAYWKAHITNHPYFSSECECLVVFILNTRRRIKGHYLVSIGTMDTILCHPREIFRLAIMASASAIIVAHNLCAWAHELCYVTNPVMCSHRLGALTSTRLLRRKERLCKQLIRSGGSNRIYPFAP
jgi:RadC-like JAB domain-containing protein